MIEEYFESPRIRSIGTALLMVLFFVAYLLTLGERPLFIPDEARYGEIAREMLASGDWIVPRLNGLLYFEKPPLGYWLNSASLWLFGETPFGVRISSALSTAVAAITVFAIGRMFFASRSVPYLATFIFLTTLEVQVIGNFSVLDPVFAAVLNIGILVMAASSYSIGRRRFGLLAVAGVFFGLAFLTKGFLALALPALVLTPWLLIRKEYAFLIRHAWVTVVFAVLTIAPWALAIHLAQPDFWHYFFWVEHIQRFAGQNAQHKQPFYFFLMFLPALGFPWIFLLPATLKGLRDKPAPQTRDGAMLLLVLWAIVPFVFFSIASGKLETYILPCFVPLSVITAVGLSSPVLSKRAIRVSLVLALLTVILFSVALAIFVAKADEVIFTSDERLNQIAIFASLAFALAALSYAMLTRNHVVRLVSIGLSMVPFLIALPLLLPEASLMRKAPTAFIIQTYSQVPEDTVVVANGSLVRAVSWGTRLADVFVIENGGETSYGLESEDGRGRFLTADDLKRLIAEKESVLIFCKGPCNEATTAVLPPNTESTSYGNFYAHVTRSSASNSGDAAPDMKSP